MKRRIFPPPIPPLSADALNRVEDIEKFARYALSACSNAVGGLVNPEKALRILRTCVVEAFEAQIDYYEKLPIYTREWLRELQQTTIESALGLMPMWTSGEQFRDELVHTLRIHVRQLPKPALTKPEGAAPKKQFSLKQQLDDLRNECRLTVEDLAEALNVAPRSVYRHLSGKAIPRNRQIAAYEKLFSKQLGKSIHLETSGKRQ
jgi:DNA-binding XRE family transcriptional regulator